MNNKNKTSNIIIITAVITLIIYIVISALIYKTCKLYGGNKLSQSMPVDIVKNDLLKGNITPDEHFKNLVSNLFNTKYGSQCIKEKLEYESDQKEIMKSIYDPNIPKKYTPDYICIHKNKCLIIEFDEGNNFHSNKSNMNYILKWLNYNKLLSNKMITIQDKTYDLNILRITYSDDLSTYKENIINNNHTGILDSFVKYLIRISIFSSFVGCYILGQYINKKCIYKIIDNDEINENINQDANFLYNKSKQAEMTYEKIKNTSENIPSYFNKLFEIKKSKKMKGSNIDSTLFDKDIIDLLKNCISRRNGLENVIGKDDRSFGHIYDSAVKWYWGTLNEHMREERERAFKGIYCEDFPEIDFDFKAMAKCYDDELRKKFSEPLTYYEKKFIINVLAHEIAGLSLIPNAKMMKTDYIKELVLTNKELIVNPITLKVFINNVPDDDFFIGS